MGVGIFNKLKKAFKSIGQRIGGFAKKAMAALPQVAEVGKKVVGAVSPILSSVLPGAGPVFGAINKGLDYAERIGNGFKSRNGSSLRDSSGFGRSLINEVK